MQILYSPNRTDFTTVQTYSNTTSGSVYHQPAAAGGCYKLRWQNANGRYQYSNTVCLNSNAKNGFSNAVLHANGNLSFTSQDATRCLFALVSADGKLLGQMWHTVTPGANNIQFQKSLSSGTVIVIKAVSGKTQTSFLFRVEN